MAQYFSILNINCDIMIDILQGTWHLIYSNFDMWKEDVSNVTFNYSIETKDGKDVLLDEVKYLKAGKEKNITGYDHPEDDTKFTWRGKGMLGLLSSNWQVEWFNHTQDCMVISFEKTMVTPAGVDILTRSNMPNEEIIREAKQIIDMNERLRKAATGLYRVNSII